MAAGYAVAELESALATPADPMAAGFFDVYIRDLTHERPLHPDTLRFLAAAHGFKPGDTLAAIINGQWQRLVIVGIALALPLARLLRVLLFGITASDPVTFVWVSLALILVAAAACYVPARRALSIDPVKALRLD